MKLLSTTMICRVGLMFGCVMFGIIADSVGRRVAVAINIFTQLPLAIVITFCDSQSWFQLLVFLKSLFGGATVYMGLILSVPSHILGINNLIGFYGISAVLPTFVACEIASNRWRSRLVTIAASPRVLAVAFAVPLANSIPNLETYSFIEALFGIFLIVLLRWVPESPQWLLYNRKIHVAEKLLHKAALSNKVKLCDDFKIRPVNHRAYYCLDETRNCVGILTTYNIRVVISVIFLLWILFSFQWSYIYARIYYGGNAKRLSSILICFVLILSILNMLLSKKLILRHILLLNILMMGVFSTAEILFPLMASPHPFSMISISSGLIVYALLLNISPRLFAIKLRATLTGCCFAVAQMGTMTSYLIFVFLPLNNLIYVSVDIAVMLAMVALCLVLLDVDGREIPDMMEDMDYFSELSKPLRWATQKTNSPSNEEVEMRIYSFGSAGQELSHSYSTDRLPAQRIGFIKFWRNFADICRRRFHHLINHT